MTFKIADAKGKPLDLEDLDPDSLKFTIAALNVDRSEEYDDPICSAAGMSGSQWCYDAVRFRPLGAVTQPLIHWINRPTYQQANEIQGHRPR